MELALNLAWLVLAICLYSLWLRFAPVGEGSRRMQWVALLLLIVILLPAISLTDDLQAAQNPAEIDTCLRRDHDWLAPHAMVPIAIALAVPFFAGLPVQASYWQAPGSPTTPKFIPPALSSIENRPPPAA